MSKTSLLRRVRSTLAPARRHYESRRRIVLTAFFRHAVTLSRAIHLLPPAARSSAPEHILVINLTPHLGDAIMLLPLIERLRSQHPAARIDVAVEAQASTLFREVGAIDNVYAFPLGSRPPSTYVEARSRVFAIIRIYWLTLRSVRPTITLNPRWGDDLFRSSILAYLTGAPRRIAYASSVSVQAPYRDNLSTEIIDAGHGLQEAVRFAALAASAGLITAESVDTIASGTVDSLKKSAAKVDWPSLRDRLSVPARPFAVIAPGASMARRVWPLANWAEVASNLRQLGLHVVLLAGKSDADLAESLATMLPPQDVTVVAGTTSLLESVALIARAAVFLGNDSGPGHIAGALGVITITLFTVPFNVDLDGPSAPERVRATGPNVHCLAPLHCIPPCTNGCMAAEAHCITLITPDDVARILHALEVPLS